jgi:predicted transcriptional regulator
MRVATGTVHSGTVVLGDPSLAEGTQVWVLTCEKEAEVKLSAEELAELEAGVAEAERGETISGEEHFARLRRYE